MLRLVMAMATIGLGFYLISSHQSKKRPLLVFGPSSEMQAQVDIWKKSSAGFEQRNVAIMKSSDLRDPEAVEKELSIKAGKFAVVLIGTDGRTAMRMDAPVDAARLFEVIDSPEPARSADSRP